MNALKSLRIPNYGKLFQKKSYRKYPLVCLNHVDKIFQKWYLWKPKSFSPKLLRTWFSLSKHNQQNALYPEVEYDNPCLKLHSFMILFLFGFVAHTKKSLFFFSHLFFCFPCSLKLSIISIQMIINYCWLASLLRPFSGLGAQSWWCEHCHQTNNYHQTIFYS